jgi:hypothetical protein
MSAKSAAVLGPRVCWPQPHFPLLGLLLDDAFAAVPLHWDQSAARSFPCDQSSGCLACRLGHRPRFKLFAPALGIRREKFVLETTLHGISGVLRSIDDQDGLRGLEIRLSRCTSSRNARVVGSTIRRWAPFEVPCGFDVRPILDSLYGHFMRVDYWTRERLTYVKHDDLVASFQPEKDGES